MPEQTENLLECRICLWG